jgi:hypothetical protein
MRKSLDNAILKALDLGQSSAAGKGGDFIPDPLANTFIGFVRDKNFARQLFTVVPMATQTRNYPKILGGAKVYHQRLQGGDARKTGYKTATLKLDAKKFMARIDASAESQEDANQDMDNLTRMQFTEGLAECEEQAFMVGDTNHATTETESEADETTWFVDDHRTAFDGLLTLALKSGGDASLDTKPATPVDAGTNEMSTTIVRKALYNLGKYGRTFSNLVLILNPWSVNQLMDDSKLVTLDKYGPNATIFTGEIGKLWGKITVINSAFMTSGYGVITHMGNPIIGDRRRIKLVNRYIEENDAYMYVISERLDFTVQYEGALCALKNLDLPDELS